MIKTLTWLCYWSYCYCVNVFSILISYWITASDAWCIPVDLYELCVICVQLFSNNHRKVEGYQWLHKGYCSGFLCSVQWLNWLMWSRQFLRLSRNGNLHRKHWKALGQCYTQNTTVAQITETFNSGQDTPASIHSTGSNVVLPILSFLGLNLTPQIDVIGKLNKWNARSNGPGVLINDTEGFWLLVISFQGWSFILVANGSGNVQGVTERLYHLQTKHL